MFIFFVQGKCLVLSLNKLKIDYDQMSDMNLKWNGDKVVFLLLVIDSYGLLQIFYRKKYF